MTTRLPGLAFLAAIRTWTEEAISILNGPILLLGSLIGLVSLLTDGAVANASFGFVLVWAISQAVGYDMQLLACSHRVVAAWRVGNRGAACLWALFTGVLGYSVGIAAYVFSVQSSEHITEAAALAQAGYSYTGWLLFRAVGFVVLVILAGATRYTPSLPVPTPSEPEPTPSPYPPAPKRSGTARSRSHAAVSRATMTANQERRLRVATGILARTPRISDRALARALECSPATASRVRAVLVAGRAQTGEMSA